MGQINQFQIASCVVLGVAQVLIVVGVATDRWVEGSDFNDGLFQRCNTTTNSCGDRDSSGLWFAARSILIDSCVSVFLALLLLVLFMLMVAKDKLERYRKCCSYSFPNSVLSSSLFAAVLIAVALILIDVDVNDNNSHLNANFGYSFYLSMVASIIAPVGGGLGFHGKSPKPKVASLDDVGDGTIESTVAVENGHMVLRENGKVEQS